MNPPTQPTPENAPSKGRTWGQIDLSPSDPRDYARPDEVHRPLSLWILTFVGLFLFGSGIYVQRYSGNYDPSVFNEESLGINNATNAVQNIDPYVLGKRIFENTCVKCHQPDGLGVPGQYPPLVGSEWLLTPGTARIIRIVLDGLHGPISVKGLNFDNIMVPWRDALNDAQIAAVLTYVRGQKEWGNTAAPVTAEEVANIRKKTQSHAAAGAWTAPELLAIPEHEPEP